MPNFSIKNLPQLENSNNLQIKYVGQALRSVKDGLEAVLGKLGVSADSTSSPPPAINALTVVAANGVADCQIIDNNSLFKAIEYFMEYSTDPAFGVATTHVVSLGAARNARIPVFLGATDVYFRAYSQYRDSVASAPVNFGGATPTAVATGGAGPALGTGQLAGTATATGQGSGSEISRNNAGLGANL